MTNQKGKHPRDIADTVSACSPQIADRRLSPQTTFVSIGGLLSPFGGGSFVIVEITSRILGIDDTVGKMSLGKG